MELTQKVSELLKLKVKAAEEQATANAVKLSPEFIAIEKEINGLMEKKAGMIPDVPSSLMVSELSAEIDEEIRETGIGEVAGLKLKYKVKKAVNTQRVMEAIGGDFGLYQELSDISQVKIKSFAKTLDKPQAKELMNCIEVRSETYSGFEIAL